MFTMPLNLSPTQLRDFLKEEKKEGHAATSGKSMAMIVLSVTTAIAKTWMITLVLLLAKHTKWVGDIDQSRCLFFSRGELSKLNVMSVKKTLKSARTPFSSVPLQKALIGIGGTTPVNSFSCGR